MATHGEVKDQLRRFEIVEWRYDGLGGKIIPWTKEHGGHSDDPSVQAFVLKADGSVLARAPDGQVYQPGTFTKWVREQADAYERMYPPTRVPLLRSEVVREPDGEGERLRCPALVEAREAGKHVLLYFGRDEREDQPRKVRSEVKAARKFESTTLDSKKAAEAAEGWVCLRLDLANEDHAAFGLTLGVEKAPALLVILPRANEPTVLAAGISGASLAHKLRKAREAE